MRVQNVFLKTSYNNLQIESKDLVFAAKWGLAQTNLTTFSKLSAYYEIEQNSQSFKSNFGTLSLSDFIGGTHTNASYQNAKYNNWLMDYQGWLLNYHNLYAYAIGANGVMSSNFATQNKSYLVLYLNSDVIYQSGNGTSADPYIIK